MAAASSYLINGENRSGGNTTVIRRGRKIEVIVHGNATLSFDRVLGRVTVFKAPNTTATEVAAVKRFLEIAGTKRYEPMLTKVGAESTIVIKDKVRNISLTADPRCDFVLPNVAHLRILFQSGATYNIGDWLNEYDVQNNPRPIRTMLDDQPAEV